MSAVSTGYDQSVSTYSPDGRIFQVEYAAKAVENAHTVLGIRTPVGVVLALEKHVPKLLKLDSPYNRRIQLVDRHVAIISAGMPADGRALAARAQEEAASYKEQQREAITVQVCSERLGMFTQAYTLYSSVRPFGASTLMAGVDKDGPALYMIEPSGVFYGYRAVAMGKHRQLARTELEKLNVDELSLEDAVHHLARILVKSDEKNLAIEMAWSKDGQMTHVPDDVLKEAVEKARKDQEEGME